MIGVNVSELQIILSATDADEQIQGFLFFRSIQMIIYLLRLKIFTNEDRRRKMPILSIFVVRWADK